MDILDREILLASLTFPKSVYALEKELENRTLMTPDGKTIKSNYPTVYRHVKTLQDEGLLTPGKVTKKDGSFDERDTEKPEITPKGLFTLLTEGNLQRQELRVAGLRLMGGSFPSLPNSLLSASESAVDDVLFNTFFSMKPKLNMNFFDEKLFFKTMKISFVESLVEEFCKMGSFKEQKAKYEAESFGRKHIPQRDIDALENLLETVRTERDKFDHLAKFLEGLLDALRNLKGEGD